MKAIIVSAIFAMMGATAFAQGSEATAPATTPKAEAPKAEAPAATSKKAHKHHSKSKKENKDESGAGK